jgi:hypothetical protein
MRNYSRETIGRRFSGESLTVLELGRVPVTDTAQVVLVLAFVVPLEALSGLFAFLARDSGAATGLSTLSAAWAATAFSLLHGPPGARHSASSRSVAASRGGLLPTNDRSQ